VKIPFYTVTAAALLGLLRPVSATDASTPIPNPSITFTSSTFSGAFASSFLFDGQPAIGSDSNLGGQWAGSGVGPMYVDLDFGSSVSTDCFGYAQRQGGNPSLDKAIKFELFFSDSAGSFSGIPDVMIDSGINSANNDYTLYGLGGTHSGRYLRFRVTGNGGNVGGSELRFYPAAVGQPSITTSAATSISASGATVNGEVTDPGSSTPAVTIFYGLSNGGTDPGAWTSSVSIGNQGGGFSANLSGLQPNLTYFFTARATNDSGTDWASPVLDFTTLPAQPTVINLAATDVFASSATLGAEVTNTGGDPPLVTIYYGTSDGGTVGGAWDTSIGLGPQSGQVSAPLSGLNANTQYYFRSRVANAAGNSWAPTSGSFMTASATLPAVVNQPASGINGFSASLGGQVADTGNDPPVVTIFYGTSDGGTVEGAWESSTDLGVQAGGFSQLIDGLNSTTNYRFRARATNAAGTVWAASSESFTTTAFVPVTVYLNEFLAETDRDSDGLRPNLPYCDEDGDPEDWIELYNPGASAIDIGGYYLTDYATDLTKWSFPLPTTIPANGYLVVFASNKNRAISGQELHTNFRLNNNGEYLAMVGADGVSIIQEFTPGFPQLAKHFSYGLVPPASGGSYDHFEEPTPGAANSTTPGQPAGDVVFNLESQTFPTGSPLSIELSLATPSPTAVIRYTSNGSAPTSSSSIYSSPITVSNTTQIRARVYDAGFAPGPIGSETYLRINPNVANFTSDLPVVILDDFGAGKPTSDKAMHWTIYEPDSVSGRSSPADIPDFQTRGRMKVRGSSSAGWPKYSLSMEAWNNADEDKNVSPLGLPSESDWVLSGRYEFDRALMRNELIYELSNQIGRYAPRTKFVEVFINTGNGVIDYNEDYMGVYALIEKIKRDDDRVDIERLTKTDLQAPEVSGGYIFKIDRVDPGDSGWTTALGIPGTEPFGGEVRLNHVYPKEDDIFTEQRDYIRGYVNEFEAAINAPGYTNPTTGLHYSDYIEIDSWVDHIWLNMLAQNPDALRLSTIMHKPRGGKLRAGPVWDFDRTMQSTDGRDNNPNRFSATSPATDLQTWGWWEQLFDEPDFEQRWIDRWAELREDKFSDVFIDTLIDGYAAELSEAQARNFSRWSSKSPRGGSHASEVSILKTWLDQHTAWIDGQFLPVADLSPGTGQVSAGSTVVVNSGGVTAYYTTDGSDPRLPGGGISPSASIVPGGGVLINVAAEVVVRTRQGASWGAPARETYVIDVPASSANLVVSEIMYHPLDATPSEVLAGSSQASDFEFIEVHNPALSRISLDGVVISQAFDFEFSGSDITELEPGGYAIIARDQAAFETRYGLGHPIAGEYGDNHEPDGGMKLSNGGEEIMIRAMDGSMIQNFIYDDREPWPVSADGSGYSLVLVRPVEIPDHGLAESWRSSVIPGGNPGASDSIPFAGTAGSDIDGNGVDDLIDHAIGHVAGERDGLPELRVDGETLTVSYQESLGADDVLLELYWSEDLVTWRTLGSDFQLLSETPDENGRRKLIYETNLANPEFGSSGFVRLRATLLAP